MFFRVIIIGLFATGLFGSNSAFAQDKPADETTPVEKKEGATDAKTPVEDAKADPKTDAKATDSEGKLGPGGKPLRTDYPGTEESKQGRMDTDQIKGLNVDPNSPQTAYGLRIRELETKIDDLKEKVFQSKTRIVLLRETLLSGNLAGSRAIINHKTELGSAWKLSQATYSLDGQKIYGKVDKGGDLSSKRSFEIYNSSVSPGTHKIAVVLKYQGTSVGIFPYFKGYSGDIKSACEFNAQEGKIAQLSIVVFPKGGITTSIEQTPNVRCDVAYYDNIRTAEQEEADAKKADGGAAADGTEK